MRQQRPRRPWHSRLELRLAAAAAALVIVAALAAALRGGDGDASAGGSDSEVSVAPAATTPAATATPTLTATPSPTSSATPDETETASPTLQPSPTATSSPEATETPTIEPTPTATTVATAAAIELRPIEVGTGETLLVSVEGEGATSARIELLGSGHTLLRSGTRFWGVYAVPLTAAPGAERIVVTLLDASGEALRTEVADFEVVDLGRPIDYITLTAEQASVLTPDASAREAQLRAEQFAQFDREPRWAGAFSAPVTGPITSQFGVGRSFNGGPVNGYHGGTDYGGEEGTPVLAAGPGRVSWTGEMPIRGNTVMIDHGAGVITGYHHLSAIDVEVGMEIDAGTRIGAIGSTGLVTGPHLHWELTIWGLLVDGQTWLREAFVAPPELGPLP